MSDDLLKDFEDYAAELRSDDATFYFARSDPGFDDFTKEILKPGIEPELMHGCVGIRSDDCFWVEARIPYKFADLHTRDIVRVLWPDIIDPVIHLDVYTYQQEHLEKLWCISRRMFMVLREHDPQHTPENDFDVRREMYEQMAFAALEVLDMLEKRDNRVIAKRETP